MDRQTDGQRDRLTTKKRMNYKVTGGLSDRQTDRNLFQLIDKEQKELQRYRWAVRQTTRGAKRLTDE